MITGQHTSVKVVVNIQTRNQWLICISAFLFFFDVLQLVKKIKIQQQLNMKHH